MWLGLVKVGEKLFLVEVGQPRSPKPLPFLTTTPRAPQGNGVLPHYTDKKTEAPQNVLVHSEVWVKSALFTFELLAASTVQMRNIYL